MSEPRSRGLQLTFIALTASILVVLVLLVASVDVIKFQARRSMDFQFLGELSTGSNTGLVGADGFPIFYRIFMIISISALIIGSLINKRWRRIFLTLCIVFVGILYLVEFLTQFQEATQPAVAEATLGVPAEKSDVADTPEPEFKSSGFQYVTFAIALAVLVVAIASVVLVRFLRKRYTPSIETFDELYDSLSDAAARIRAGEDPYRVVLFCYQEMIRLLSAKGRIDPTYLTPREFEQNLQTAGLAGKHIQELTRIFEVVRYGSRVDDGFGNRALACLDAIQEAHAHT